MTEYGALGACCFDHNHSRQSFVMCTISQLDIISTHLFVACSIQVIRLFLCLERGVILSASNLRMRVEGGIVLISSFLLTLFAASII
jgi:hypothetical protein